MFFDNAHYFLGTLFSDTFKSFYVLFQLTKVYFSAIGKVIGVSY